MNLNDAVKIAKALVAKGGPGSGPRKKGAGEYPEYDDKELDAKIEAFDKKNLPGMPEMSDDEYEEYQSYMKEKIRRGPYENRAKPSVAKGGPGSGPQKGGKVDPLTAEARRKAKGTMERRSKPPKSAPGGWAEQGIAKGGPGSGPQGNGYHDTGKAKAKADQDYRDDPTNPAKRAEYYRACEAHAKNMPEYNGAGGVGKGGPGSGPQQIDRDRYSESEKEKARFKRMKENEKKPGFSKFLPGHEPVEKGGPVDSAAKTKEDKAILGISKKIACARVAVAALVAKSMVAKAEFREEDHPRDGGKFTSGGGSKKSGKKESPSREEPRASRDTNHGIGDENESELLDKIDQGNYAEAWASISNMRFADPDWYSNAADILEGAIESFESNGGRQSREDANNGNDGPGIRTREPS